MDEKMQLLCMNDSQAILAEALKNKNLHQFKQSLALGCNAETEDSTTHMSIFEKCCQTPDHHEFIAECIKAGCDVNRLNDYYDKRPINFVAESQDIDNIRALLDDPTIQVDQRFEDLTPIHLLAEKLNENNFDNIFGCMKLLVSKHANLNIPNKRQMTPILTIAKKKLAKNRLELILKYFLENTNIDLDSYRDGEARSYLSKHFPELKLPEFYDKSNDKWDFTRLITTLRNGDEITFLHGLDKVIRNTDNEDNRKKLFREYDMDETLLLVIVKKGMIKACERLLRAGADVNYKPPKSSSALKLACVYGNWEILQLLLKCHELSINESESLLTIVIRNIGEEYPGRKTCDYNQCFKLLVKRSADIDVNQKDIFGNTPLHFAVKYKNKAVIADLLENGAYIGSVNKFSDFSITDIDPKLLENHFNSCITTNDRRPGDDNYEIHFAYKNLVPIAARHYLNESSNLKTNTLTSDQQMMKPGDEMAPIEYMARTNELKYLIKHPLIASFLFLKWHRLALIFYANFLAYSIYSLAMIFYIIFCYGQESSKTVTTILVLLTGIGGLYVLIREIIQLILSPKVYFKSKENYVEIVLIVMTILVLCNKEYDSSTRKTISAFTILLAIAEFFLLTGSLPILSFSTHLVMLKTVSKSFLKSLVLYSMILIGFAICFYVLLGEDGSETDINKDGVTVVADPNANNAVCNNDDNGDFNKFTYPGLSIIKTVVMLTGEFEAANINFEQNESSYIMFLLFVFLISTVLVNLLNGLAVSDIQAIKNEAELMNFINRALVMSRYEKIMSGRGESACCNFILRKLASNMMSLFPNFLPAYKIIVLPNGHNTVLIPNSMKEKHKKLEENITFNHLKCVTFPCACSIGNNCARMESKIVKYATNVLEAKEQMLNEVKEKNELQEQIENLSNQLDQVTEKLNAILSKFN